MRKFIVLIGEIFFIACLQSVAEVFMDMNEKSYQAKILNLARFIFAFVILFCVQFKDRIFQIDILLI